MDFLEFDKHFKKIMSQERSDVNVEQLLTDLNLKKSNKRYWIPILLLGLSIALGIGLFQIEKNPVQGQQTDSNIVIEEHNAPFSSNLNTAVTATIIKDKDAPEPDAPNNTNSNTLYKRDTDENKAAQLRSNINNSANASFSASTSLNISVSVNTQSTVLNNHIAGNSNIDDDNNAQVANDLNENSTSLTNTSENYLLNDNNQSLKLRPLLAIEALSRKIESLSPLVDDSPLFKLKPQDCPSFREKQWHFALVPEISYDFQFKNLSTTDVEFLDLISERNANESTMEGYSLGLSGMMQNKKGIYFKAGLNYSAFTERMDFSRTYTEMDTTQGIISITESESGDTLTIIYGDIIINRELMETTRAHYRFNMIDIPLSAGLSFDFGSFGVDVEAGIHFNIRTTASGRVLNSDFSFTDIGEQALFKTSTGIGYFGALFFRKDISHNGSIIFGPKYKVRPQHFNTDINPIKQQYRSLGFHLGYIYRM